MTAHFEVGRTNIWRHCDLISGEKRFSRRVENLVASIHQTAEPKPNTLETNFPDKKRLWKPYL